MSKEEPLLKRLHISGLTNPSLTHQDLTSRFSSFGVVHGLEGVGSDGNGFLRPFTYMNLTTTPNQLHRLTSILSGSTWKGMVLKIQEAKPAYTDVLDKERKAMGNPLGEELAKKKKKKVRKEKGGLVPVKLGRGVHGLERKDMSVVDTAKAKTKKHWHITPLQHLIHPLVLRPTHPLPKPTLPLPASSQPISVVIPVKRKTTSGRKLADPPKRARSVVVDPRRYDRTHLGEHMLGDGEGEGDEVWVCEEGENQGEVKWRLVAGSGAGSREETVVVGKQERLRLVLRKISGGLEVGGSKWDELDSAGVMESSIEEAEEDEEGEDDWVPLGEVDNLKSLLRDSPSPELSDDEMVSSAEEDNGTEAPPTNSVPPSPSLPIPTAVPSPALVSQPAGRAPASSPKQTIAPVPMIDRSDPLYQEIAREKKQGLNVLSSLGFSFGDDDEPTDTGETSGGGTFTFESDDEEGAGSSLPNTVALPWDDDDEDEDVVEKASVPKPDQRPVKRALNVAPIPLPVEKEKKRVSFVEAVTEKEEEAEEKEEEEEEEEEGELDPIELAMRELRGWTDEEEQTVASSEDVMRLRGGAGDENESDDEEKEAKVKVKQLKNLFAPSAEETTSFSLGLDLDIDMDAEDPTLTASLPTPAPYHAPQSNYSSSRQPAPLASSSTQQTPTFRPDTALPYFFPFLHLDEKERSKGPKVQAQSMIELERGKPRPVGGFWKVDTEEQAQQRWETEHLELTREYKKRHREARKRRKRRGGAEEDDEEEEEKD